MPNQQAMITQPGAERSRALRVALIYAALGALWILGSDWLLAELVADAELRQQIGAVKGWAFVGVTAALLFVLLARAPAAVSLAPSARLPRRLAWAALAAALLIVAVTAQVVQLRGQRFESGLVQQVESMAELRSREVSHWFLVRREHAWQLHAAKPVAGMATHWLERRDDASRGALLALPLSRKNRWTMFSIPSIVRDARAEPDQTHVSNS